MHSVSLLSGHTLSFSAMHVDSCMALQRCSYAGWGQGVQRALILHV
jgi:hypothetical protein